MFRKMRAIDDLMDPGFARLMRVIGGVNYNPVRSEAR